VPLPDTACKRNTVCRFSQNVFSSLINPPLFYYSRIAKHLENFPSVFGQYLMSMAIPLCKGEGCILLLKSGRDLRSYTPK